jgi:SAM-dependent methyltransferase
MMEFTCNLCGQPNRSANRELDRETPSCSSCGSNVRTRGLLQAFSRELFGANLTLPDFPRVKSLRGIGTSDSSQYADRLASKLDYRNTFHDREPRFDIADPGNDHSGKYDFLLSSEVFEHVVPPAAAAFQNAFQVLKPTGFLVFTVPYSLELSMAEHFPDLHEFGLARLGGRVHLINRTREGAVQVFDNLVFHKDGSGTALEMREFSETSLKQLLTAAGFESVRIYSDDYPPFGIVHSESCSLPIAARRAPFAWGVEAAREVVEQYRDIKRKHDGEMQRLCGKFWFRMGHRLGLL